MLGAEVIGFICKSWWALEILLGRTSAKVLEFCSGSAIRTWGNMWLLREYIQD